MTTMERFLYWVLFVAGLVLAAWLPAKSAFADADLHPTLMRMTQR
jgi:hypothetical protein